MNSRKRKIVTILLVIACVLSGVMLSATPPFKTKNISSYSELDSLILETINEESLRKDQVRVFNVEADSTFYRKVYRIRVTPYFSKTSFHLDLQEKLYPYKFKTPAKVIFPEKDMNIYLVYNNTVQRTIRLITDYPEQLPESDTEE